MIRSLFAFVLCLCLGLPAQAALPAPTPELYVNDYAQVLSEGTHARLLEQSRALHKATGAQIAVLTVPSLEGKDIKAYGYAVASSWKLGDADKDNGVLILLAVQDRKIRVEVGSGLEGCLPDARVGRAIDANAIPAFKKNDFDAGLSALYAAVLADVRAEYGLAPKQVENAEDADFTAQDLFYLLSFLVLIVLFILFFLCLLGMIVDVVGMFLPRKKPDPLAKVFFLKRWFHKGLWLITLGGLLSSSDGSSGGGSSGSGGFGSSGSSGGGGGFSGGGSDRSF